MQLHICDVLSKKVVRQLIYIKKSSRKREMAVRRETIVKVVKKKMTY